jgi:hypothetical protein
MRYFAITLFVLLSGPAFSAQAHMGTPQEQAACRRDATRFCRNELGNDMAVGQCLQQHRTRLRRSCKKVLARHGM